MSSIASFLSVLAARCFFAASVIGGIIGHKAHGAERQTDHARFAAAAATSLRGFATRETIGTR